MRLELRGRSAVSLILLGITVIALLFGLGRSKTMSSANNPIESENTNPGTRSWEIPQGRGATVEIQAYASATSVLPGQTLTFYMSTQREGTSYSIDIYRLGWYGGDGGRKMASQANQVGHAQGYYDPEANLLVGCSSCFVDVQTGLGEANWKPSYTLTVPSDWTTGVYLAKFTDANDMQTCVPFDVLGNPYSLYVAVASDTTYAAYNNWGGYSLYEAHGSRGIPIRLGRGLKVSFDRPYALNYDSGYVFKFEADAIHWLERQGHDLSYMSSVDLHKHPIQLLQHRAYVSLGHDEYWTKEMRDGVEYARNNGVSLAFLGANDGYWQMRFEPDRGGTPDRTIVSYKLSTSQKDLARDPFLARPENALFGVMYSGLTHRRNGFSWQVIPKVNSPLLSGTNLKPGQQYGCGLVGYEWDRVFANGATPAGLHVIGLTHVVDQDYSPDISNTTYYIAPSGRLSLLQVPFTGLLRSTAIDCTRMIYVLVKVLWCLACRS